MAKIKKVITKIKRRGKNKKKGITKIKKKTKKINIMK